MLTFEQQTLNLKQRQLNTPLIIALAVAALLHIAAYITVDIDVLRLFYPNSRHLPTIVYSDRSLNEAAATTQEAHASIPIALPPITPPFPTSSPTMPSPTLALPTARIDTTPPLIDARSLALPLTAAAIEVAVYGTLADTPLINDGISLQYAVALNSRGSWQRTIFDIVVEGRSGRIFYAEPHTQTPLAPNIDAIISRIRFAPFSDSPTRSGMVAITHFIEETL